MRTPRLIQSIYLESFYAAASARKCERYRTEAYIPPAHLPPRERRCFLQHLSARTTIGLHEQNDHEVHCRDQPFSTPHVTSHSEGNEKFSETRVASLPFRSSD